MKTAVDLRMDFHHETGIAWLNSQDEPDVDYVLWLENKIIKSPQPDRERIIEMLCKIAIHVGLPESKPTIENVIKGLRKAKCKECDKLADELLSLPSENEKSEGGKLYPCPYDKSCRCVMDEGCAGCETFAKSLVEPAKGEEQASGVIKTAVVKYMGHWTVKFTIGVQTFFLQTIEGRTKKEAQWVEEMLHKAFDSLQGEVVSDAEIKAWVIVDKGILKSVVCIQTAIYAAKAMRDGKIADNKQK